MPAKRKKELVVCRYFSWRLGRRNGVYVADGRSNAIDQGRHSLGTRDFEEARRALHRLDAIKAVDSGRAPATVLDAAAGEPLSLEEGQSIYMKYVSRPLVLGGAGATTAKRYRAVLNKFLPFAKAEALSSWQEVTKEALEAYGAWLDDEGYCYATEYLELTTLKQVTKVLVAQKKIPASCIVILPLKKPQGSSTYCYRKIEVDAILEYCERHKGLIWLGQVILALVYTGLRISELADLRWSDLDLDTKVMRLIDARYQATKTDRANARTTKSHRDRALPIHPDLWKVLIRLPRHSDGRAFHGPLGGRLKPDTVRNILVRDVLTPLAGRFPATPGEKGFHDGRLHSFRHYFCSQAANNGVPEQMLMAWLGHRDCKMVQRYYHLSQDEAQKQISRISFVSKLTEEAAAG